MLFKLNGRISLIGFHCEYTNANPSYWCSLIDSVSNANGAWGSRLLLGLTADNMCGSTKKSLLVARPSNWLHTRQGFAGEPGDQPESYLSLRRSLWASEYFVWSRSSGSSSLRLSDTKPDSEADRATPKVSVLPKIDCFRSTYYCINQ